ncbi:BRE1 [Acrasis kona]|uniref:BRE1 n=1 Tax=Acrasis kona TaxID=1008807 RepID=A0AAW2YTQ9_9EUKA
MDFVRNIFRKSDRPPEISSSSQDCQSRLRSDELILKQSCEYEWSVDLIKNFAFSSDQQGVHLRKLWDNYKKQVIEQTQNEGTNYTDITSFKKQDLEPDEELVPCFLVSFRSLSTFKSVKSSKEAWDAFAKEFISTHTSWNPPLVTLASVMDPKDEFHKSSMRHHNRPILLRTTSKDLKEDKLPIQPSIMAFPRELVQTASFFFKAAGEAHWRNMNLLDENAPKKATDDGYEVLDVVEIISRSHVNRLLLKQYEIFKSCVALADAAVRRLQVLIFDQATNIEEKRRIIHQIKFVIVSCLQIFANFMESPNTLRDPDAASEVPSSPRVSISVENRRASNISSWIGNEKRRRQQYMTDTFSTVGATAVLLDLLTCCKDAISKTYDDVLRPEFTFLFNVQVHALHIARAIILSDCMTPNFHTSIIGELGAVADRFSALGGLDLLVKYLGWPVEHVNYTEGKKWERVNLEPIDFARCTLYYNTQMLALQILTEAVHLNDTYMTRLTRFRITDHVVDLALWVNFFFSTEAQYLEETLLENQPMEKLNKRPPAPHHEYEKIESNLNGFIKKITNGKFYTFFELCRELWIPGNEWEWSLLKVFQQDERMNQEQDFFRESKLKLKHYSEFPLYVMDALTILVSENPSNLDSLVSQQLYKVLFGEYFYTNQYAGVLGRVVRDSVLHFMRWSGSINNRDNKHEVNALLRIMTDLKNDSEMLRPCVDSLLTITYNHTEGTLKSIHQGKTLRMISDLILPDPESQRQQPEPIRHVAMCILDVCLSHGEIRLEALECNVTLSCLFSCLFIPQYKEFASGHIQKMMSVKSDQSIVFELFFAHYTDAFLRILSERTVHSYHLMMDMLDYLQRALKTRNPKILQRQIRPRLDKVIHLLTFSCADTDQHELCIRVLRTLTLLISDNHGSKRVIKAQTN